MVRSRIYWLFSLLLGFVSCETSEVGKVYQGWKEGEVDIHHIYTGRGESSFLIFPDGTSLLIDAGDWDPKDYPKMTVALPDTSRRAGEWIARYVSRVNPKGNNVDYLMVSHFHNDHTGDASNDVPMTSGRNPDYKLTGIMEVGEYLHFSKAFDRGYPDYSYPLPIEDEDVEHYRAFVAWKTRTDNLQSEKFEVGVLDQIKLLSGEYKYKDFHIRNLVSNGIVWMGEDADSLVACYDLNPENLRGWQNENTKSMGFCLSYGAFRYFTAGDLSGTLLDASGKKIEIDELVAEVCGKVDVCKANHHAYLDAMSEGFVRNINADAYIIPVWDYEHIQPSVLARMASRRLSSESKNLIFATNIPDTLRCAYKDAAWMPAMCQEDGHVVVKVFDGGSKYKIYVLSASDEQMLVKAVYGPFVSKGER